MPFIGTVCDRLDVQGYTHVEPDTLAAAEPWVRWSPAICTTIIAIGTALASPWILWGLVPLAVLGAAYSRHPFDYIYNLGVRRLLGTPPLPPHGAPRRFACGLAAAWVTATGAAFAVELDALGFVLGGMLIAVGALVSTTHFCIPSIIYGLLFGRPQRMAQGH